MSYRTLLLLLTHVSRVQLCATPQTAAHQAPVPGILQARTLEWVIQYFRRPQIHVLEFCEEFSSEALSVL